MLRAQSEVGFAADEENVAEPSHRRERRLRTAERRDPAVLDQDVVERQQQLAVATLTTTREPSATLSVGPGIDPL